MVVNTVWELTSEQIDTHKKDILYILNACKAVFFFIRAVIMDGNLPAHSSIYTKTGLNVVSNCIDILSFRDAR